MNKPTEKKPLNKCSLCGTLLQSTEKLYGTYGKDITKKEVYCPRCGATSSS